MQMIVKGKVEHGHFPVVVFQLLMKFGCTKQNFPKCTYFQRPFVRLDMFQKRFLFFHGVYCVLVHFRYNRVLHGIVETTMEIVPALMNCIYLSFFSIYMPIIHE